MFVSSESVALIIVAVRRCDEFGYVRVKSGEDEGEAEVERRTFKADTGHKGEGERRGIWITWNFEESCLALAHFTVMWAPGGPNMMSPLRKWHLGSKTEAEGGALFDSLRNPK